MKLPLPGLTSTQALVKVCRPACPFLMGSAIVVDAAAVAVWDKMLGCAAAIATDAAAVAV